MLPHIAVIETLTATCTLCCNVPYRATPTKVVERAKRTMAGIFDASATDGSKAHIKNVFGNMYESKKLRHMPPSTTQTAVRFLRPTDIANQLQREAESNICIVTVPG